MDNRLYEVCAYPWCWHFVEENFTVEGDHSVSAFVHLDDGEQEYDHDAKPDQDYGQHKLDYWRANWPILFQTYPDGKIGPNSLHFVGWSK